VPLSPGPMRPQAIPAMAKMRAGSPPPPGRGVGAFSKMMRGVLGRGEETMEAAAEVEETATPAQRERVRKALEAFVQAFTQVKAAGASFEALEKARMELMKALADALVIATAVPLLQAFLRSAAVEIIAALKAGAAPDCDRHAAALQAALDEARGPLDGPSGKAAAGSFWEASI